MTDLDWVVTLLGSASRVGRGDALSSLAKRITREMATSWRVEWSSRRLGLVGLETKVISWVVRRSIERRARQVAPVPMAAAAPDHRDPGWSRYETQRELIVATYLAAGRNLSETERRLKERGISATRRHLAEYLQRWGVREAR